MRILIADDDSTSRRILQAVLRKLEHEVVVAATGEEAWAILQRPDTPRLAILDWMMPDLDGIEICRRLRGAKLEDHVYVILLTSRSEKQDIVDGLTAGAKDYITKPFDPEELRARVATGRRVIELQVALEARVLELQQAMEQINALARTDPLTGLANRRHFDELFIRERERAQRLATPLCAIAVDLDHFKRVNDQYGHGAGDAVLKAVAGRLTRHLRPYDVVARFGGEEFVILAPGATLEQGHQIAERMRAGIKRIAIEGLPSISASFGVALLAGAEDSQPLLARADAALYRAKDGGRDRVELELLPAAGPSASILPAAVSAT
jgi:diguanylate cyclase (GGDEF)-like protein